MMKKNSFIIMVLSFVLLIAIFTGCTDVKNTTKSQENSGNLTNENNEKEKANKNIVNLSPPIFSMLCALDVENQVVGTNPRAFGSANEQILKLVYPNYKNINVDFVGADFRVNKESLLNLKPDIILSYGSFAEELKDLNIPIENLMIKSFDSKETTLYWENKLSEILEIENPKKMQKAWANTDKIIEKLDKTEKIKGLYIFSNTPKGLFVSGEKSYGNSFMNMVGIENVAKDVGLEKQNAISVEVSMEDINKWNPDIIFIGMGLEADKILEGKIPNQNWENINAVKNGMVFNIPSGMYDWFAPCSDSPIMPIWMAKVSRDNFISDDDFYKVVKDFYRETYDLDLTDETINTIFR